MEIKINNITYKIKFVNKLRNGKLWGQVESDGLLRAGKLKKERNTIRLVKRDNWEDTLFHEITHILFTELAEKKPVLKRQADRCNQNELFVDEISKLMKEVFIIKKQKEVKK